MYIKRSRRYVCIVIKEISLVVTLSKLQKSLRNFVKTSNTPLQVWGEITVDVSSPVLIITEPDQRKKKRRNKNRNKNKLQV